MNAWGWAFAWGLAACHASRSAATRTAGTPTPDVLYLRTSYDEDPSVYLGRFIEPGTPIGQTDETSAFASECSAFVKAKVVRAGGVLYDEYLQSGATGRLGAQLPGVARVFGACCRRAPGMCSDRIVVEFLKGVGATYVGRRKGRSLNLEVTPSAVVPGLDVHLFPMLEVGSDTAWHRGTTFTQPVYFAFRVGRVRLPPAGPPAYRVEPTHDAPAQRRRRGPR